MPDSAIPRHRDLPVWPEHMPAVQLFDACLTQWRMGPRFPVGLDYPAVFQTARVLRLRCRQGDMQNLQVMEQAALAWFVEQGSKK